MYLHFPVASLIHLFLVYHPPPLSLSQPIKSIFFFLSISSSISQCTTYSFLLSNLHYLFLSIPPSPFFTSPLIAAAHITSHLFWYLVIYSVCLSIYLSDNLFISVSHSISQSFYLLLSVLVLINRSSRIRYHEKWNQCDDKSKPSM